MNKDQALDLMNQFTQYFEEEANICLNSMRECKKTKNKKLYYYYFGRRSICTQLLKFIKKKEIKFEREKEVEVK